MAALAALLLSLSAARAQDNVIAAAQKAPDLSVLVLAVQSAGLAKTLGGEGPFTAFAPTDAAFQALPAGTLDDLLKPENKEKLAQLVSLHISKGLVPAKSVTAPTQIATLGGATVMVTPQDGRIKVGDAPVTKADVNAFNGVIHVIDSVLMPSAM